MSAEVALELTHLEWSPACLLAQWVSDGNSGLTRLGSVRAAVERCDREATASTEHKPAPGRERPSHVRVQAGKAATTVRGMSRHPL